MSHDETLTLADLPVGVEAKVMNVDGDNPSTQRLMEMGILPGVLVSIIKTAPFGDPLQIRVRGYDLAIRRIEAQAIGVSYEQ